MIQILVDPAWSACFPKARVALLEAHGLEPLATHPELERQRRLLEQDLRDRYGTLDRAQLRDLPVMKAFEAHYRPHGRTYHVLQQLESVAVKGRPIPARLCAVTALFMAELAHGLVSAGQDLERVVPPLVLAPSRGGERYRNLGGGEITLPEGDMTVGHGGGVLSSVLGGPESASPLGPGTRDALFTIYAPARVPEGALEAQLAALTSGLALFSPGLRTETWIGPA